MSRLFRSRRERTTTQPVVELTDELESGSSGRGLRKKLVAVGLVGLAVLAARRVRKSDRTPSMDEVKESVGDVRSGDGLEIPIGETGEESDQASKTGDEWTGTTQGAIGTEPMPGEDLSSGTTGGDTGDDAQEESTETDEDLSAEVIEDRASENAHEEPSEPGEMTVGEDIAEGVADEDGADAGTEEAETDEADTEADEAAAEETAASDADTEETDEDE